MKNVLVIVYYFPPMGGSGVQRPLKFIKYLRKYGWNPIVLCPETGAYHTFDNSLLSELEALEIEVHRVTGNTPLHGIGEKKIVLPSWIESILRKISTFFWFPDNKRGWIRPGLEKAREIISSRKIDLIFSTAPPYSNLILAKEIKEEFGIPAVMDLRDDWLESHLLKYPTKWHYSKMASIERETLRVADHIITINNFIAYAINERKVSAKRVSVISQGFDPEDFKNVKPTLDQDGKIRFLYSGTFYPESGPEHFLEAIERVIFDNPKLRDRIELQFQGLLKEEHKRIFKEKKLDGLITDFGYVNHSEAVKNLLNADILWLNNAHSKNSNVISLGKTYEYMASKKPILALVPDGDVKSKLLAYEASYISEPEDIEAIKDEIFKVISGFDAGNLPAPKDEFVQQFSRKELTAELASIFNVISK